MFELIGALFTFIVWAVAIFLFGGGIFLCFFSLKDGTGGEKAKAVIAIILGIVAFAWVYSWCESIVWCMLASGIVFGTIGNPYSGPSHPPTSEPNPGPSFGEALTCEILTYERDKAVVKNAIREYENER